MKKTTVPYLQPGNTWTAQRLALGHPWDSGSCRPHLALYLGGLEAPIARNVTLTTNQRIPKDESLLLVLLQQFCIDNLPGQKSGCIAPS